MRDHSSTTTIPRARLSLVPPPGALIGRLAHDCGDDELVTPDETLEELEARELRLLAGGTGEHLPAETVANVEELRRRQRALRAASATFRDPVG
jgi:hypothetical protein